jgi:hypothetical protein
MSFVWTLRDTSRLVEELVKFCVAAGELIIGDNNAYLKLKPFLSEVKRGPIVPPQADCLTVKCWLDSSNVS